MTELYSLRARYYDPNDGRFLSRDTYQINFRNPIELNRYVYTANNPVNYSDPTGHDVGVKGYSLPLGSISLPTIGIGSILGKSLVVYFHLIALLSVLISSFIDTLVDTIVDTWNKYKNRRNRNEERWTFVGYHGTSSNFSSAIRKQVNPPLDANNFYGDYQLGYGFYVTKSRAAANYFAEEAVLNHGGSPVLLRVFAKNFHSMDHAEVPMPFWWNDILTAPYLKYDYVTAPISGMEQWQQVKFNAKAFTRLRVLPDLSFSK